MTKLDELIQELCPDGVKYLPIPELFITRNGYTPSKANNEFWENGTIPWFRMEDIRENGRILTTATQYVSEKAVKGKLFPADSIIIATSATIGEHALIKVPSLANQRFTYLTLKDEFKDCVDMMFVFYYCFRLDEYCKSHLNQGNFASVDMKQFAAFKFPVPPLPVQREIVRILDNFTEITAELTAELTARKQQYEFYRDQLLTFAAQGETILTDKPNALNRLCQYVSEFIFVKLSDISVNCDSLRKPVTSGNREAGNIPYYGASGIVDYVKDYIFDGDYLLISEDGANLLARNTPIAFSISGKNWVNNHAHILRFNNRITQRYVEIYLNSIDLSPYISGGAQPKLNQQNLYKIPIPLPSYQKQKEIVTILDRFDTLCTDLSSGLPAEIEARQKQYEYYRDKLLSFEEKI